MGIDTFITTMDLIGREAGIGLRQTAPGVPEYDVAMGPFPARIRVGFDMDAQAGLVPQAVLEIIVGDTGDRWAVLGAWSAAPTAAMAGHGLPVPLPVPELTLPLGPGRTAEIAYRVPLDRFDTAWALGMLHVGASFASFMARDLLPCTDPARAVELARHGIAAGAPVPPPGDILAAGDPHLGGVWEAA